MCDHLVCQAETMGVARKSGLFCLRMRLEDKASRRSVFTLALIVNYGKRTNFAQTKLQNSPLFSLSFFHSLYNYLFSP